MKFDAAFIERRLREHKAAQAAQESELVRAIIDEVRQLDRRQRLEVLRGGRCE